MDPILIQRLVGVYHARGSLWGELVYVAGKLTGRAHCALCDITHGTRRRPEVDAWIEALPVPFDLVHLDERTDAVTAASDGATPCVLAGTAVGFVLLLGTAEIHVCDGEIDRFVDALARSVDSHGLAWPVTG
ncbi:MAG: hypothetical protein ACRDZN_00850 [Acidimicrobiales bacterium]